MAGAAMTKLDDGQLNVALNDFSQLMSERRAIVELAEEWSREAASCHTDTVRATILMRCAQNIIDVVKQEG